MTPDQPVPCSVGAAGEPLPGTAPPRRVWAIVEHPGPWGRDALPDAPWPGGPGFGVALQSAVDAADVRALLGRRTGRAGRLARPGGQVMLARTGPGGWAASLDLDSPGRLLDLDWTALRRHEAVPPGWQDAGAVWGVCTQATRDACCARLGRPLAQLLDEAAPQTTWEISHSGGHRFAAVVIALPEGLVYGRVGPADVPELLQARAGRRVVRRLLRGAVHLSPAQQCAQAALRERLDDDRLESLLPADDPSAVVSPGTAVRTGWVYSPAQGSPSRWVVEVAEVAIPDRPASCGKPAEAARAWQVTALQPAGAGVRV